MSLFDGGPDDLTYGQALLEIADRISWPTELHKRAALRAIQIEHDLVPPDPDVIALTDPRDAELAELRASVAKLRAAEATAAKDAEFARLQAEVESLTAPPAAPPAVVPGTSESTDPGEPTPAKSSSKGRG